MAKKSHFFLGFILGAASSLAATYLLTPQTSDELKKQFNQKKDTLADRAADYYDYAKDATADWRESATDLVDTLKDKVQPAKKSDEDLDAYDAQTDAVKDSLTDASEVAASDDFDDIVLDGKSAFAQAKDDDFAAEKPEAPASDAPKADEEAEPETSDKPEADTDDKPAESSDEDQD